ncbi:glycosyltransferase family 2 protein [Burkholderia anthina]|uniref:glycosyltransferase family 2 protein n=1 Tax=Burkholderia anthina TaxID=179879 RepID=UPI001AA0393B|nr:glycosyltransferase family 2 protein [Burkholderia anthina]QTD89119.1 glycosyltransferase family 2 protein [Burkholderia anthina]
MLKLGIAGIVKNEADALIEWIAYHKALGIDKFFIADNESTDGTKELLTALSSNDFLETIDAKTLPDLKPQLPTYKNLLAIASGKVDVLAFIDADEFIAPSDGATSIRSFVEKIFINQDISALALNWSTFGSSGAKFHENGLVIDRFTKRAKIDLGINQHYKTFVRPERATGFTNPHHVNLTSGRYITSDEKDLTLHPTHGKGLSASTCWEGARINHYATKSLEEFLVGKSKRGSASKIGRIKHKAYFIAHDRNDEECLIAKNFSSRTQDEMRNLDEMIRNFDEIQKSKHASTPINWISKIISKI